MDHMDEIKFLEDIIDRYRSYLPLCPINKLNVMATEIRRVRNKVLELEDMTLGNCIKQGVTEFYGELESSLNF